MWKIDGGQAAGATSPAYLAALDWKVQDLGAKTILLKNTDASNSLSDRLAGYAGSDGIDHGLVAETSLLAGETAEFHYDRQWDRLTLQVKNGSGAAAYSVDYQGQGA